MATNKPRVNVVLDNQLYNIIKQLSGEEDVFKIGKSRL